MKVSLKSEILVFTDGACSGNPGPGGWAFVYFDPLRNQVFEQSGHAERSTNNLMELEAAIQALELLAKEKPTLPVRLCSDSIYVIKGITQWMYAWKKKNWIKSDGQAVSNIESWKRLDLKVNQVGQKISWQYVPGHANVPGNDRVDELAVAASKKTIEALSSQGADTYPYELFKGWAAGEKAKKITPYYLSYLEGNLEKHLTWPECEARVKGKKAKFKKISSAQEEEETLKNWGIE